MNYIQKYTEKGNWLKDGLLQQNYTIGLLMVLKDLMQKLELKQLQTLLENTM